MQTVTIDVKQEHIDKGYENDCINCPIAISAAEVFRELFESDGRQLLRCSVGCLTLTVESDEPGQYLGELPHEAQLFIQRFDSRNYLNRQLATPFSFDIDMERIV